MTFSSDPRAGRPVLQPRRRGVLVPTLVVLGALVVGLALFAEIWTEVLWFNQLGFGGVYRTRLLTQVALFLLGAGAMAGAVGASLSFAYRSRPVYAPVSPEQQSLDRYRESLEPLRRIVILALPAGLGLFAGSAASQQWETVLLWLNRVPFNSEDAQFGLDIGFFVFTLPFLRFVLGFLTAVVVLAGLAGAATHYLYGGLRLQGRGERTTRAARVHLALLGGLLVLLQAGSYWLDRYGQLVDDNGLFTGAGYTGVNAVIPARTILAGIAVICALLFIAAAFTGSWRIPAVGVALLLVSAIAIGGIYPAVVQRFQVQPSEQSREAPYIQRNIESTRAAFGIDSVEETTYTAQEEGEAGALREDAETTASIRLLDPSLVSPAFRQLQQGRQYYGFPDILDVDRYDIDGETRDAVVAVRELDLNGLADNARSWINDHTVYTHGFGLVAAYGNQRQPSGEPAFFQGGIPTTGELEVDEPRVYFGERSPDFSIVGAPEGAAPRELDFPDDEAPNGQRNNTYTGDGGPRMGDPFNRLMYAIKFRDQNILLSDAVNPESQILYDRHPRERVEKVAPFLTLDGNTYPAVVDGRVKWIVDGYTTSNQYPYSSLEPLGELTIDSLTATSQSVVALRPQEVNYIRNSVKATVDAYDGSVTLYAWDEQDPVLRAWQQVFPDAVQPMSAISGELMSHLRYPEDLFKVQRTVLSSYHVEDAAAFYSEQDFWRVPNDPTKDEDEPQPPYYLTLQMPTQDESSFSLTSTYIPRATGQNVRNVLTGFVAVDAEAGDADGERRDGYGQIRLLTLPRSAVVNGPGQVQNDFNSNPRVSESLNVLRLGESQVLNGNLLTLPVGGGLLYVQPVYVQSAGETSYPLLRRVLVSFGDEIGFADTLDAALDQVFGGDSGAEAGDADTPGGGQEPVVPPVEGEEPPAGGEEPPVEPTEPAPPAGDAQARLQDALQRANQAIQDGQAALAESDFAAYGEAQERLQQAIEDALAAEAELRGEG
ncbi:MAG: UPF0182 family protein [Actinomycetes bacterium]